MKKERADRARLLLDILPYLSAEKDIAIKGGTAINMFCRDFPRVSVDIDLVYLPLTPREETLDAIDAFLKRFAATIQRERFGATIVPRKTKQGRFIALTIEERGSIVKIEPNTVLRGSVFPVEKCQVRPAVFSALDYEGFINVQVLSVADLYGGKMCAALDRQHPRDLFDIMVLFENQGITRALMQAFVIYLAGHDRPMSELLCPRLLDMKEIHEKEFSGMTERHITWPELADVRTRLIAEIHAKLTRNDRNFLLSLKQGEPDWHLVEIPGIERLPSLQWKLLNIRQMNTVKRTEMVHRLAKILGV